MGWNSANGIASMYLKALADEYGFRRIRRGANCPKKSARLFFTVRAEREFMLSTKEITAAVFSKRNSKALYPLLKDVITKLNPIP